MNLDSYQILLTVIFISIIIISVYGTVLLQSIAKDNDLFSKKIINRTWYSKSTLRELKKVLNDPNDIKKVDKLLVMKDVIRVLTIGFVIVFLAAGLA
jgi:hypothetical protein